MSATSSSLIRRSTNLNPEETDLWELCYYAGVTIDPQVFHVLVDLLHMDVHPKAVLDVLKSIAPHSKYASKEGNKDAEVKKNDTKLNSQKQPSVKVARNSSKTHLSSGGSQKSSFSRNSSSDKQSTASKGSKMKPSSASNITTRR